MPITNSVVNQGEVPAMLAGLLADIPAADFAGRLYISTDTLALYRDNGAGSYDLIGGPGIGTISGSGSAGQVSFFSGAAVISGSNNLFWDNVNGRLGVNTNTPGAAIDIHHSSAVIAQLNNTGTNDSLLAFQNQSNGKWRIGNSYNAGQNNFVLHSVVGNADILTVNQSAQSAVLTYNFTALSIIKSGGTSSQFLKADGSIDNSAYITASSTNLLTNKSGNISMWTNDSGYVTSGSLSGYVPYSGATTNVNLGTFNLTATAIIKAGGTSSQFLKADGSIDNSAYITASSTNLLTNKSGNISMWTNDSGYVTSGSLSGYVPYSGASGSVDLGLFNLTATAIIKAGGTSSQFLKADGSIDSNVYTTASSTTTFTNKSGNISMWTNDSGYITSGSLSGYVPYSGATTNVNLGAFSLTASIINGAGTGLTGTASSLSIGGNAATATTATNSSQWNSIVGNFTTPQTATIANAIAIDINGVAYKYTAGAFQTWLGLGSYAYRSSGLAELSGATFTGAISGTTASFSGGVNMATSSGNVGIGTTSPSGKLDIIGGNASSSFPSTYANTISGQPDRDADDGVFGINYYGYNNGVTRFRDTFVYDGKTNTVARFIGSSKTTLLAGAIDDGINKLIVNGGISSTTASFSGGGTGDQLLVSTVSSGANLSLKMDAATDKYAQFQYYENGSLKWNLYNDYTNDNFVFGNSGGAKVSITQSGNVLVSSSTTSTSITTGALVVTGGVGIGDVVNTGSRVNINGATDSATIQLNVTGRTQSVESSTFNSNTSLYGCYGGELLSGTGFTNTTEIILAGTLGQLAVGASGTNTIYSRTQIAALVGRSYINGSGSISRIAGVSGDLLFGNSMNVTDAASLYAGVAYQQSGGVSAYTGTITNFYGLYIADSSGGSVAAQITNKYGIYQAGSTVPNMLNGELFLGAGQQVSSSSTNTVTNKIKLTVNGTNYYLLASTSNA